MTHRQGKHIGPTSPSKKMSGLLLVGRGDHVDLDVRVGEKKNITPDSICEALSRFSEWCAGSWCVQKTNFDKIRLKIDPESA